MNNPAAPTATHDSLALVAAIKHAEPLVPGEHSDPLVAGKYAEPPVAGKHAKETPAAGN